MARGIPTYSAGLTEFVEMALKTGRDLTWTQAKEAALRGCLFTLLPTGHLPLRYHLTSKPLTVYCKLIVVDSGVGLALSIQILPIPKGSILPTPQTKTVQLLTRSAGQGRNCDHLDQHIVNLETDHRLMTPCAYLPGNLKRDCRRREKRVGVVLLQLDSRREHV